ncbi:MAG TPA: PhzF family phenazine biosynthesis isomerase [Steroidobacteraceae bacterium]|jgi:PhzF family phenazine biosynthesis protein
MRSRIRVFQVDAFTSQRFSGNPAGVVLDADPLSTDDMQALARELNNGDTAFLLRADADDHDLRVRFFTPRREAAFVGHATLAAHAVLASLQLAPRPRQKQSSGIVEVDTVATVAPPRIALHLPLPGMRRALREHELGDVLSALGLRRADLDRTCPPTIAGETSTRLLLGLEHGATLAQVQPDMVALNRLSQPLGAAGYFLFSRQPTVADVLVESRMFCPALGIAEDPVSGNAHAMLGAYLWQQALLGAPGGNAPDSATIEFSGAQGHHLGRPGRVTVALNLQGERLDSVSIIGEAVVVFETTLEF